MTSAIAVRDVSKTFGGTQALRGVSLDVARGTVHALVGGNGSGKSTLIKILAGVEAADAGELEIGGELIDAAGARTAARARAAGLHFVHQQTSTFPDLTIAENLAIGRGFETGPGGRVAGTRCAGGRRRRCSSASASRPDRTRWWAASAGDPDDGRHRPGAAGPGRRPRGRARARRADREPAAARGRALLEALRRYARAGQTILYVTHRLEEVMRVADQVTVLRDGRSPTTIDRAGLDEHGLVSLIVGQAVRTAGFQSHASRASRS